VEVVFGVRFLKRFREYLELRRFLPSAGGFKYLFGTFEHGAEPLQVNTRHAGNLSRTLRRLVNPSLPALGYRELRAYHLNTKSNEFGLQVALETAQHSEKTAITSYMAGHQGATILEGVAYFSELSLAVESYRDTQAGSCAGNLISAVAIDDHPGGDPDCKEFIGCLFCKYYLLHLDAQDARKLLSMEYLIEQLRAIQYSEAEFCKAYGPTLARVRWLIELIENSSDELRREVSVLRDEVFGQECLTFYWQSKLNLLVDMGVL
jgi:hypothetical protein